MTSGNPQPIVSPGFAARLLNGAHTLFQSWCVSYIAWHMLILHGSAPPSRGDDLMNWFPALVAAALAQGLGHLLAGALVGFRFLSFTVLGFFLFPLRRLVAPWLVLGEPFSRQCLMFPTDTRDLRRRCLFFFAAGPILGLLLAVLAVAGLYRALGPEPDTNLFLFLRQTAIVGAVLGLFSLIPHSGTSNGFCLRTLLRGGQAADQLIATFTIAMLDMAGRRREDMDPGLLAALTLPAPNALWQTLGAQLAYLLALEAGRIEEARAHLAHWSAALTGPARTQKTPPVGSALEAAYFAARHEGDAPGARRHLESALGVLEKVLILPVGPGAWARSEAAVLLAEGRIREARQTLARATRLLPWREHGRGVTGRVVLDDLRALGREAASTPLPTGVEGYLDTISSHLIGLSAGKRTEIREELRPHLTSLMDAYEEMGHASEEAVTLALRRFGAPTTVARAIAKAQPLTGFWPPLRYGLCWFAGAAALFGGMAALSGLLYGSFRSFPPGLVLSLVTAFFALPAVAGWMTGQAVQEQAGRRAFHALGFLAITGLGLIFPLAFIREPFAVMGVLLLLIAGLWMPVGCLAAGLSGARVQRLRRERQEAIKIARR